MRVPFSKFPHVVVFLFAFVLARHLVAQIELPAAPQPVALGAALPVSNAPVVASAPTPTPTPAPPPQFLAPDAIDFAALLPPPPAENSLADRADRETVMQVQADRTPAQVDRAERVAKQNVFTFASPALGPWFTAENLPQTAAFFKTVTVEGFAVATLAKRNFNRSRPLVAGAKFQTPTGRMRSTSYPSGHSSDAATWAGILVEIFPEHRDALAAQVRETMWGRVLAGVHYPTDTQAGKMLGEAIAREMLKSPALQAALSTVRAECAAAAAKSVVSSLPPKP
jgi:acid phosphatase (class A)